MPVYYTIEKTDDGMAVTGGLGGRQTRHPVYGPSISIEDAEVESWMAEAVEAPVAAAWIVRFPGGAEIVNVKLA